MDSCCRHINVLSPKPGVTIWYGKITTFLKYIFKPGRCPVSGLAVNEIFKKDSFVKLVFTNEEINIINNFKSLKKQMEWMGGRYLIKQMIQSCFLKSNSLDQITLSYLDEGAPFLTNHPDIPVSLSHSNDYTTAACYGYKGHTLGIDIEKIAGKPDIFFLKTAFTPDEILNMEDDAVQIFKHWTIKEAYLKYIQKGFNESLHNVEIIHNEIRHNKLKINIDIYSTLINHDYVLSLVSD